MVQEIETIIRCCTFQKPRDCIVFCAADTWGILCALLHHMLLHCGTAVGPSRPIGARFAFANKFVGPPDYVVDCDSLIDVFNLFMIAFIIDLCYYCS